MEAFNYYTSEQGCTFSLATDGSSDTYKFKLTPDVLPTAPGAEPPDNAFVLIGNDQTGLGITATAAMSTEGSDIFCTVTFSQNLPAANPNNNDPCIQAQVTFEYPTVA